MTDKTEPEVSQRAREAADAISRRLVEWMNQKGGYGLARFSQHLGDDCEMRQAFARFERDILATRTPDPTPVATIMELPMVAFIDRLPVRDDMLGEQTILIHNPSATWDIAFFEASEDFPDRWIGGEHWIDITGMWPGVTAQVTRFYAHPPAVPDDGLVEALEPFAALAEEARESASALQNDHDEFFVTQIGGYNIGNLSLADFERAESALAAYRGES
ncbi:hypothetical protein [Novosphingobium sp. MMS21-SN21R]|uniref:hypothetical protein n=1 Tax=Novosphingobium sp. MMS21-SN21R TaxID=2969298 RepID=UPI00288364CE|nr:hypothetical protein [Novosphingobium sp. MMS21-SN21R]MDT0507550.1 hypothetical protein [Novosphingobium sp. MMS21-SN21R]MDT0509515.1 hypothetical protein [Novosphingobium sp. MMS21-SN21R]